MKHVFTYMLLLCYPLTFFAQDISLTPLKSTDSIIPGKPVSIAFMAKNLTQDSLSISYELKLHVVTTSSGKTYSGTLAAETESSITIKQPNGEEHTILKSIIQEHKEINQSIVHAISKEKVNTPVLTPIQKDWIASLNQ